MFNAAPAITGRSLPRARDREMVPRREGRRPAGSLEAGIVRLVRCRSPSRAGARWPVPSPKVSLMLTRIGLERILVSAAVFLSLFPSWRHPAFFFTVSDFLFCASLLTILLKRGLPPAPFGILTPYWLAGCTLFVAALIVSSLINGVPMRALTVCVQYLFAFVLIPLTIMGRDREGTINLLQVFAASVLVTNLVAIVLYYSGSSGDFMLVTGNGRLAGFIGGPNPNAQTIALACPVAIISGCPAGCRRVAHRLCCSYSPSPSS
jgi:hypothetical protein